MSTPTLRTDAAETELSSRVDYVGVVPSHFARELEIEVDCLKTDNAGWKALFEANPSASWAQVTNQRAAMIAAREAIRKLATLANVNEATREILVHVGNGLNDALKP